MSDPTPALAPDEFTGRRLGKYQIACRLSRGGMSEIFLAFHHGVAGFRKYVVLKKILANIRGQEDFLRMFVQEAKITAMFSHPNIAQVFDLDEADGELFLAMEFVPGATLVEVAQACVRGGERIPTGFTLAAVRDAAFALHYAHTFTDPSGRPRPVIHRDVAEKNVMVTYDGTTKLLDFGIAKRLDGVTHTHVGTLKGTSGYMSPEQIRGERLDARSDVFSLGVVLHECLSGQRLFYGRTRDDELLAPLVGDVPLPSKRNREVSPPLDAVVLKALARDREHRYASARELARAIEAAAADLLWNPEQSGALVQRLFSERREQTRALLGAAGPPEDSGVYASEHLGGGLPPTRLDRALTPSKPIASVAEDDEPRTVLSDVSRIVGAGGRDLETTHVGTGEEEGETTVAIGAKSARRPSGPDVVPVFRPNDVPAAPPSPPTLKERTKALRPPSPPWRPPGDEPKTEIAAPELPEPRAESRRPPAKRDASLDRTEVAAHGYAREAALLAAVGAGSALALLALIYWLAG